MGGRQDRFGGPVQGFSEPWPLGLGVAGVAAGFGFEGGAGAEVATGDESGDGRSADGPAGKVLKKPTGFLDISLHASGTAEPSTPFRVVGRTPDPAGALARLGYRWPMLLALAALLASLVVPPMTEAELRAQADVVVDATVVRQEVHALGRRIFTFSTVLVGEGTSARSYVVAVPGGDVGAIAQRVPGAPLLELGRRYRLFLGKANGPVAPGAVVAARGIVGFFRGVFVVDDQNALVPFGDDGLPVLPVTR